MAEMPNPGDDLTYIAQTAPGVVMNADQQGLANFSILGVPGTVRSGTTNGQRSDQSMA